MEAGDTIPGRQVARVVESRNKSFTKGKVVWCIDI
jgi:NADPH-dependent curcumin reductase CurA